MKTISLGIDDAIFEETEMILSSIKISRNRYINEAIDSYNRIQQRMMREERLRRESGLVRTDSLLVLSEFENLLNNDGSNRGNRQHKGTQEEEN
jgi:hypothetical protein